MLLLQQEQRRVGHLGRPGHQPTHLRCPLPTFLALSPLQPSASAHVTLLQAFWALAVPAVAVAVAVAVAAAVVVGVRLCPCSALVSPGVSVHYCKPSNDRSSL